MTNLNEDEILRRYRDIYGLGEDVDIAQVKQHWELERRLTDRLLATKPENRWQIFSQAYSELYESLPWLNKEDKTNRGQVLAQWAHLLAPKSKIFEVGSGKAELLKYLGSLGHECTATEITPQRGQRHASEDKGLSWHVTDGIHLADFEPAGHYDVVISTGVIEHFHPDDIGAHFTHARKILREGGRYIFTTPHIATGPHDLSRAFGEERAVCMHLREYDYPALGALLKEAGYRKITAIFPPSRLYRKINWTTESRAFYLWLSLLDRMEAGLQLKTSQRRIIRKCMRVALMPDNIWLSASI